MDGAPEISVVVPVYNEEENISLLLERLVLVLAKIGDYQILFALDPCKDGTESALKRAVPANPRIGYLCFPRRHERAQYIVDVEENVLERAHDGPRP